MDRRTDIMVHPGVQHDIGPLGPLPKKENGKTSKYSGLRVELGKMWNSEAIVVPVVIGSLGCISHNLTSCLKMIPADLSLEMCLKLTLLGSEKIMRSFLSRK